MEHLLLWLPKRLRNALLRGGIWGRRHLRRTVLTLTIALFINVVLVSIGLVTSWVGFSWEWIGGIEFGRFVTSASAMFAAFFWLYAYIRIWVLAQAANIADTAMIEGVKQTSRLLPGEKSVVELPEIFTQVRANTALNAVMSGLLGVTVISAYASLIPVYTKPALFCAVVVVAFVIAFATWPRAVEPSERSHSTPLGMGMQKLLVLVAIAAIIICTYTFFHPYTTERDMRIALVQGRITEATTLHETDAMWRLSNQRLTVLDKIGTSNWKPEEDEEQLDQLNTQIQNVKDRKYTGDTSLTRTVTDSAKSAKDTVMPRRWRMEYTMMVVLFIMFGAIAISRRSS